MNPGRLAAPRRHEIPKSHGQYAWTLPLMAGLSWCTTLYVLLSSWIRDGQPHVGYMQQYQKIAFVSDVGALQDLKPVFIFGSGVTAFMFQCALWIEWRQRDYGQSSLHSDFVGALQPPRSKVGLVFGSIGCALSALVAIFDVVTHYRIHVIVFITANAAFTLNGILMCHDLHKRIANRENLDSHSGLMVVGQSNIGESQTLLVSMNYLRLSFWVKITTTVTGITFSLVSAVCVLNHADLAAISEWVMAFIFAVYIISYSIDMYIVPEPEKGKVKT